MKIDFRTAQLSDKEMIFSWLTEPHVQEFWDSSEAHKQDILNFINGRKIPSTYCEGKYQYWIAEYDSQPYALLMIIPTTQLDPVDLIKKRYLSQTGATYSIDYMIGNPSFVGKGYGALTLSSFIEFYREKIEVTADTFLIDPTTDNPRAKHVYEKAGFKCVGNFIMKEAGASGVNKEHHLLVKNF